MFDGGFMTFDKGTHKLVFYYENGQGEENELIVSEPVDDKNISPALVPFTAKLNGYIVTADYLGDTWLDVTDSNENFVTTINLTYDKMTDLKAGDTVTLSYDDYNGSAEDAGIILKGTPVSYTIAQPIKVNAETAAKNVAAIKEYYAGKTNFDNYADEGDQLEIADVYYVTGKTTSSYQKIVYIEKNVTKNYYIAILAVGLVTADMARAMRISSVWSLGFAEPKVSTLSFWIGSMTAASRMSTSFGILARDFSALTSIAEQAPRRFEVLPVMIVPSASWRAAAGAPVSSAFARAGAITARSEVVSLFCFISRRILYASSVLPTPFVWLERAS